MRSFVRGSSSMFLARRIRTSLAIAVAEIESVDESLLGLVHIGSNLK